MTRTATEPSNRTANPEMNVVGYLVAAGSLLLLLPVLPFLAVLWLFDRLRGNGGPEA